jgi:hypothetical protein
MARSARAKPAGFACGSIEVFLLFRGATATRLCFAGVLPACWQNTSEKGTSMLPQAKKPVAA